MNKILIDSRGLAVRLSLATQSTKVIKEREIGNG